jgi:hypothetical protein
MSKTGGVIGYLVGGVTETMLTLLSGSGSVKPNSRERVSWPPEDLRE